MPISGPSRRPGRRASTERVRTPRGACSTRSRRCPRTPVPARAHRKPRPTQSTGAFSRRLRPAHRRPTRWCVTLGLEREQEVRPLGSSAVRATDPAFVVRSGAAESGGGRPVDGPHVEIVALADHRATSLTPLLAARCERLSPSAPCSRSGRAAVVPAQGRDTLASPERCRKSVRRRRGLLVLVQSGRLRG